MYKFSHAHEFEKNHIHTLTLNLFYYSLLLIMMKCIFHSIKNAALKNSIFIFTRVIIIAQFPQQQQILLNIFIFNKYETYYRVYMFLIVFRCGKREKERCFTILYVLYLITTTTLFIMTA